jgi:beta-glucosidase
MVLTFERLLDIRINADCHPVGYPVAWDWIADNIKRAQDYLVQNTTLGIPAITQTEGKF